RAGSTFRDDGSGRAWRIVHEPWRAVSTAGRPPRRRLPLMYGATVDRSEILPRRLAGQRLASPRSASPAEAVAAPRAIQAQDHPAGLWAAGLRTPDQKQADVVAAIAKGTIVRTWPMRGTLHFVAAADVRWMLALLAPRVIAASAGRHRQLELDDAAFRKSRA